MPCPNRLCFSPTQRLSSSKNHNQHQDNAVLIEPLKAAFPLPGLKLIKSQRRKKTEHFNCDLMEMALSRDLFILV